jgi:Protein of unknown function (DUF3054)
VTRLEVAGLVAILLFATIGQLSHDHGVSLGGYAGDALPLLGGWIVMARLTGRFLPTWLIGVTAGVAIRMVVLDHYRWNELAFLAVSLVFIGAVAFVTLKALVLLRRGDFRGARRFFS